MPIKDKSLYPKEWPQISQRIRERAGNRCETCGVANGAVGYREPDGSFVQLAASVVDVGMEVEAAALCDGHKIIKIVLTCAHIDPEPSNVADSNLVMECCRCHNLRDAPMRAKHAAETRLRKRLSRQPQLLEAV